MLIALYAARNYRETEQETILQVNKTSLIM